MLKRANTSLFILVLLCNIIVCTATAQADLVNILLENIERLTLQDMAPNTDIKDEFIRISDSGRNSDIMMRELFTSTIIPVDEIMLYVNSQSPDGSWPDIDYKDPSRSSWSPAIHVTRMLAMAKAYRNLDSGCYGYPVVSAAVRKGLDFWLAEKPECVNWWYNEIGCPKLMGPAAILLIDELTSAQISGVAEIMGEDVFSMTGQNKVWLAGNMLMKGILLKDETLIRKSAQEIEAELLITTDEGLQPDWSFHQHGPQMQFGNYGLAYAGSMSYWARVLAGTELAIHPRKLELLRNYILEGLQWTIYRGMMDISACGRQVFKNAQKGKSASVSVAVQNMIDADTSAVEAYQKFLLNNMLDPLRENTLTGCRYYPRSDYFIFRTSDWFASVRMHSDRIIGYEMTNDENLQGEYSSDGAMTLMISGEEYTDIFPVWNWKRLPGVTNPDNGDPIAGGRSVEIKRNESSFAGAVSDGSAGVAAMVLDKDGTRAKKAWFFTGDVVVCLGSGISHAERIPVYTTVNQTFLNGDVTCGGKVLTEGISYLAEDLSWVHHNHTGYHFLGPQQIYVGTEAQNGSWNKVALMYDDEELTADIFSLVIDHGKNPADAEYAYCVLPCRSVEDTRNFSENPSYTIISNSVVCQAVSDNNEIWQYVFYKPAEAAFTDGAIIKTSLPCIVMVRKCDDGFEITVSDPTQSLQAVLLEIGMELYGECCSYDPVRETTGILIHLPKKERYRSGSTTVRVSKSY